jgi:hypothetical protein
MVKLSNSISKHSLIDAAYSKIIIIMSVAAIVSAFSVTASISLFSHEQYKNRVISAQQKALKQLKTDVIANNNLVKSYKAFVAPSRNIIGGSSSTVNGSNNGDNGKIILDALPSKYDFPAAISSIVKLLQNGGVTIGNIQSTDELLQQQGAQTSPNPIPATIPFSFTVSGSYQNIENLINELQNSIRPIQFQTMQISGSQSNLTLTVTAQTYYQAEKIFKITTRIVQ